MGGDVKYRRRFFLLFLLVAFLSDFSFGQDKTVLNGKVFDGKTHEPLKAANIKVLSTKYWTTSDDSGRFKLSLPKGDYRLKITFVGYKPSYVNVSSGYNSFIFAGLIQEPSESEITVTEEYKEVKFMPQRFVLNNRMLTEIPPPVEDVFYVAKTIPGVHSVSDKSGEFNVRGSHFDEHLSLVSGVPVSRPFHLKAGSLESIGIIYDSAIQLEV